MQIEKIKLGQFYTRTSPFEFERFKKWLSGIPDLKNKKFIEPFAGSNSIVQMMLASFHMSVAQWASFDIAPEAQQENLVPQVPLQQLDTISFFPKGFDVCITNPPYLAKNSATRKGMEIDFEGFQDLFEVSLGRMLKNCGWVAAIIPESFLTREVHRSRLEFVISLNIDMFHDTDFPVCLAVFSPDVQETYEIWRGEQFIGMARDLRLKAEGLLTSSKDSQLKFNDPEGLLGLWAIDNTKENSIRFLEGKEIHPSTIKVSSRAITRISSPHLTSINQLETVIEKANLILAEYRESTQDVFLTSFKGLRIDGKYRRRIDWNTASKILNTVFEEMGLISGAPNNLRLF